MKNTTKLSSLQTGEVIDNYIHDECEDCLNWDFKDATFVHRDDDYQSLEELYEDGHDHRDSSGNYEYSTHMKLTFEN